MSITKEELIQFKAAKMETKDELEEWLINGRADIRDKAKAYEEELNRGLVREFELKSTALEAELGVLNTLIESADKEPADADAEAETLN